MVEAANPCKPDVVCPPLSCYTDLKWYGVFMTTDTVSFFFIHTVKVLNSLKMQINIRLTVELI